MSEERLKWRSNPTVVAQYFVGDELPQNVDVHLKPNEACAVIENGALVGVATSTRLTINPKTGALASLLSKKEPFRSFFFAHLGPHDLLIRLEGMWADGTQGKGIAGLKIRFDGEKLGRLLTFPASGKNTVTLGDIAARIEIDIKQQFARHHMATMNPAALKENASMVNLLDSSFRTTAQPILEELGILIDRTWMSWSPTQHERILAMQSELELMEQEGKLIQARDRLEMDRLLAAEIMKLEHAHQIRITGKEYEVKAEAATEIARIRTKAEREAENWNILVQRARLEDSLKDERSERDHTRKVTELHREMDLDDLKREREEKRREWIREQEKIAQQHNNEMLKGAFDVMNEDDEHSE